MPRILVVEDSPTQRQAITLVLQDSAFEVETAADAESGFDRLNAARFDLVLTDLHLPGQNGFDLCRHIKADPQLRQIPVVLITGSSSPKDVLLGLDAGADGFITKGRDPDEVVRRIRRALSHAGTTPSPQETERTRVVFLGQEFEISATRERLLNVLLSAFEDLLSLNDQLHLTNQTLKETQAQLVHSEKLAALGTLAAGMAHEINNPLAFIANNVAILEQNIADLMTLLAAFGETQSFIEQSQPEMAAKIMRLQEEIDLPYIQQHVPRVARATQDGLQRVGKIVQGLLSFSRHDRAAFDAIDLHEAINQCLDMIADSLDRLHISIVRRYGELPRIECAPAHLNQVLLNLLLNAMQAIESSGRPAGQISITTRSDAGTIVLEFADDGCGIPPDVLPKIFDPFFTTKPVGQGTGLGLSICDGIISEHGGGIEAESTPGQGSCFRIRLPVIAESTASGR